MLGPDVLLQESVPARTEHALAALLQRPAEAEGGGDMKDRFKIFLRWRIAQKLWCSESYRDPTEWKVLRLRYLELGGTIDDWCILFDERVLEN